MEMELEKSVLLRIEESCGCTKHFPRLVASDNISMTSTYVGTPMSTTLFRELPIVGLQRESALEQVDSIIQCLNKSRVRHLDGVKTCKNVAIMKKNMNYTVALYDFDISSIDEIPLSEKIQNRFDLAITFNDYLSRQHNYLMKCLGFKN